MTSPPDVQNVPDVWGLLEEAANVERVDRERLYYFVGRVRTALAQRDRFVLVPKQWSTEMAHAGYLKHEEFRAAGTFVACYECGQIYNAMLAAAPKPEGKL